jgi:predicted RNase H-like nuclease (RuvC/YqgF family)
MSVSTIGGWWPWSASTEDSSDVTRLATQVKDLSRQLGDFKGGNVEPLSGSLNKRLEKENDDLKQRLADSTGKYEQLSESLSTVQSRLEDELAKNRDCEARRGICEFSNKKLEETLQEEQSRNKDRESTLMQQVHDAAEKVSLAHKRVNVVENARDHVAAQVYDTLVNT